VKISISLLHFYGKLMKLGLGTAQFGLNYGISNTSGQTTIDEVRNIFKIAHANNINLIDTAALYGNSEKIIGESLEQSQTFKIVTKTPYFNTSEITQIQINLLETSINKSLSNLKAQSLYGVLFHNANDLFCKNGERLYLKLKKFKSQKIISKIGFSVYSQEQIDMLLNHFDFDLIQLPINILDQKLLVNGYLKKLKSHNIEIHARSVFLQGLLLMIIETIPAYFQPIHGLLKKFHIAIQEQNISPIQAALYFVKNITYIDHIIIGVNNSIQLIENINAYNLKTCTINFESFACFDESFTNPSSWKISK
jgi:aryl-alcohol dehydrogenase-like predicted oxidoreductase